MAHHRHSCCHDEIRRRRERVAELTREGRSTREIASIMGLTTRTVTKTRATAGIARDVVQPMTAEELDLARAMLQDGASRKDVAHTLGRGYTTIVKHFPQYTWTRAETLAMAVAVRQANRRMRELGVMA